MPTIWKGDEVLKQITAGAISGVEEICGRIETEAKRELYPGHGKRSGTLQRAIQAGPARSEGSRVIGSVGVKGVRYALRIHAKYEYIVKGYERVQGQAASILTKHMKS
jgi:hypothetical protein